MEKNLAFKNCVIVAVIFMMMLFNISSVNAEWGSVANKNNWDGSTKFNYDSIKIKLYKPPIYILSVDITENKGMVLIKDEITYKLNYDTKQVSRFYPLGHPNNRRNYEFWADLEVNSVDWKIAVRSWERAYKMEFNPETPAMKIKRFIKAGETAYFENNWNAAIKAYESALSLDPNIKDENLFALLGWSYHKIKNYEQALKNLNKAIQLASHAGYYVDRGVIYLELKNYEQAINDFNKALELNPDASYSYFGRGKAYNALGRYEQAVNDFTKYIQHYKNEPHAYNHRGGVYKSLKKYEQAINDYNTAIKLDSKEPVYYFNRGLTYEEWQHYKEAKKDFEKALKLNPNYEKAKKGIERITNAMKKK